MTATADNRPAAPSDAQRAVLAAALQRPDAAVALPARLKGRAAQNLARALLDRGLVREARAKGEQPVWRRDEATGRAFVLVLTKAGRALVPEPIAALPAQPTPAAASSPEPARPAEAPAPDSPRPGSKLARVVALLGREGGTGVSELMAATGWLPHTTRAALTGLRKRGYALARQAGDGGPVYRIVPSPAAAA